jgi:hypothetical protein
MSSPTSSTPDATNRNTRADARQAEFMGPTSIPTFLQELNGHLISSPETVISPTKTARTTGQVPAQLDKAQPSHHIMSLSLKVLECIPDAQTSTALIDNFQSPVDAWLRPVVYRLSESLHETFKPYGKTRRANLENMARVLHHNMGNAVEQGWEDAEQWLASISGSNMRWECVGMLFPYWAMSTMGRSEGSGDDSADKQSRRQSEKYSEAILDCIDLCGRASSGNIVLVHLLFKACYLVSFQHGDASE